MKKSLGIYIHIPFCLKKCRYCDFCSLADKDTAYMSQYVDQLCRRMSEFALKAKEYIVDTVYFGGGTPSLLPVGQIERIMNTLRRYDVSPNTEITLECNPATANKQYFQKLRATGINRLSIGLQSAHDSELKLLGRAHTASEFVTCFEDARAAGFDNVSADLMYGIPDQTMDSFAASIDLLASLSPEHISAYGLAVEEGTYFHKHLDELRLADDDIQAEMYCMMDDRLSSHGYEKYEISNFSKKGRESRHNLRYWQGLEYLGFGVAAHSYFDGRRFGNSRDISAFMRGEDITEESYIIDNDEAKREFVMLGLRLSRGICLSDYKKRFGADLLEVYPQISQYIGDGFIKLENDRVFFTQKGFLVSNALLSDMLC